MPTWKVHGIAIRVIDGDTFVADLDLGWKVWLRDARVRLAFYDAPERTDAKGPGAKAALSALLPSGRPIALSSWSLDKYGRCLAAVTLADGRDVATEMKAGGWLK